MYMIVWWPVGDKYYFGKNRNFPRDKLWRMQGPKINFRGYKLSGMEELWQNSFIFIPFFMFFSCNFTSKSKSTILWIAKKVWKFLPLKYAWICCKDIWMNDILHLAGEIYQQSSYSSYTQTHTDAQILTYTHTHTHTHTHTELCKHQPPSHNNQLYMPRWTEENKEYLYEKQTNK